jgi:alpha-mannosidase
LTPDLQLASGESILRHVARGALALADARALFAGSEGPNPERGSYTTHRDVKARNAALERALGAAEELAAWCVAVRVPKSAVAPLLDDLRSAWTSLLRAQAGGVLAGTAPPAAYADAERDYERAERIVERVTASARSILPRADLALLPPPPLAPVEDGDGFTFTNDYLRARVRRDGTIVELCGVDGRNLATIVNGLALYADRGDAATLDPKYERHARRLRAGAARVEDGALLVPIAGDGMALVMRVALAVGEPYLRVEIAVNWQAKQRVLRAEHRFAVRATEARFGTPHGSVARGPVFESCAQRWVHVSDGDAGVALLASDLYGWSATSLRHGGMRIGTSLLRAPVKPDPAVDRGEQQLAYAFAPTAGAGPGALEAAWRDYAEPPRVRLFTCDDPAVLVVATKPADDGNGVIVRVRECDGEGRRVDLRSGGRLREASPVDEGELPVAGDARVEGELLSFVLPANSLRSFRVLS